MQDYRGAMKSLPNGITRSDGGGSVLTPVSKKSRISTPSLSGIPILKSTKISVQLSFCLYNCLAVQSICINSSLETLTQNNFMSVYPSICLSVCLSITVQH